jgi:hypothetical protein
MSDSFKVSSGAVKITDVSLTELIIPDGATKIPENAIAQC